MLNLVLHCGGRAVDRHQIDQCVTPAPTHTWQPIPHAHLLDLVTETLTATGMRIVNQAHALSREGQRYFGLMQLTPGSNPGSDNDDVSTSGGGGGGYGFVVGIRNSHDQSFPAALCIGSGVFVCDNLAFSSEVVLSRRHTRFIVRDLPQLVERAVGQLGILRFDQDRRIAAYRAKAIDDRNAHHLLVKMIDAKVLPVTRLPAALDEWRTPGHAEFAEGGKHAWRLFNAVTEAIKGRCLDELPRRIQALHGLMDRACAVPSKLDQVVTLN